jgi:hypothetical protein
MTNHRWFQRFRIYNTKSNQKIGDKIFTLRFHDDLLDLGIGGSHKELGAVEADAAQDLQRLGEEAGMEYRLGEVDVAEMAGTLGHVAGAGLAAGGAVHRPLPRVHQAAQLGPPALVSFGISRRYSNIYCTVP